MSLHLKGTHEVVTKGGGLTEIFLVLFVKIHKREEEIKHGKARENFCACVCFFFFLELPGLCVVVLTRYSLIGMRMGKAFNISWVHTGR